MTVSQDENKVSFLFAWVIHKAKCRQSHTVQYLVTEDNIRRQTTLHSLPPPPTASKCSVAKI
jgi:hypothetical protein